MPAGRIAHRGTTEEILPLILADTLGGCPVLNREEATFMITEIDAKLLEKIADLTGRPAGAFNIRKDMGCEARQSTEHIAIDPRADGKPGIDIRFQAGTKGETCHIPVIISQTGMSDMVYNDFYVADDCDVNIVAGCGIHNSGCDESRHDGVHTFHIGKNCRVHYTEKHYGEDAQGETGKNVMNPQTIVYLGENSTMQMDTIQIRGIDSTLRDTRFYCEAGSEVVVTERLLTHGDQTAESDMTIELNGEDAQGRVISRSVAQDSSRQVFHPVMVGNSQCFGHVQCDSIIMGARPYPVRSGHHRQLSRRAADPRGSHRQDRRGPAAEAGDPGADPGGGGGNHPEGILGISRQNQTKTARRLPCGFFAVFLAYRHRYENQPSLLRVSAMVQPLSRRHWATSSARSSMMPEHRKMPPSRTRGRTVEARALMTSATMLATTTS